jgi:phage portal protein BeeE
MAAQESAQLEVMKNAGNPKLAIVHPGPLSAGAREAIAQKFTSDHGGAENAGKPLVLAEGMRVERISSTLEDSGISAARSVLDRRCLPHLRRARVLSRRDDERVTARWSG